MKRPTKSLDDAIMYVALNDDPTCTTLAVVKQSTSIDLLAEIYEVSRIEVARRVVRIRKAQ